MKGKSQQILEFLFKNGKAYTKNEILSNITLEKENDNISKTLYDMKKKRGFIQSVGTGWYRITDKGMNHAAISYGMSGKDIDIRVVLTKPEPVLSELTKVQAIGRASRGNSADVEITPSEKWEKLQSKPEASIPLPNGRNIDVKTTTEKKEIDRLAEDISIANPSIDIEKGLKDLEKALKYKPSNKPDIKDLDQKLEVLSVISRFVDSKLSFWVEEVKKDLKG